MSKTKRIGMLYRQRLGLALGVAFMLVTGGVAAAQTMPNACPVDGCEVKISAMKRMGDEIELTLDANFQPDVSKNHIHVWWGEKYTVKQVGRNAEPVHGVAQGRWHRHDEYPVYVTQGAASITAREGAQTLCVSAADRNHNILDVGIYDCVDVSGLLSES